MLLAFESEAASSKPEGVLLSAADLYAVRKDDAGEWAGHPRDHFREAVTASGEIQDWMPDFITDPMHRPGQR